LKPLEEDFYTRNVLEVARELLGKYFVRKIGKKILIGKIVETEAYSSNDPASHSYRGRTPRNDVMFWKGGYLYVYFTYGMHFCANVVTGREGIGEAVLIRAVEPISGIDIMHYNRYGTKTKMNIKSLIELTNGPAKFCQAFKIGRKENGISLLRGKIFIVEGDKIPSKLIRKSNRIGIKEGTDKEYRFFINNNLWVSKK